MKYIECEGKIETMERRNEKLDLLEKIVFEMETI